MPIADTPAARLVAYARANPSLIRKRALTFTEYLFPKNGKVPVHYGFYITETTNSNFHEHPFWPVYASKTATVPSNPDIVVNKGAIEEWYLDQRDAGVTRVSHPSDGLRRGEELCGHTAHARHGFLAGRLPVA